MSLLMALVVATSFVGVIGVIVLISTGRAASLADHAVPKAVWPRK